MITIIDYNAGNLTSVKRALDYLGIQSEITQESERIRNAERVIFPGVGHAQAAMTMLKERKLDLALIDAFSRGTPVLGICLGSQIILSASEEGDTQCLGLISGSCPRFRLKNPDLKIPHMGWNAVVVKKKHAVLKDVRAGDEFYFVHSYYTLPKSRDTVFATAEYEIEFPVALGHRNLFAVQFHPEKSGAAGLQILKNFSEWDGVSC